MLVHTSDSDSFLTNIWEFWFWSDACWHMLRSATRQLAYYATHQTNVNCPLETLATNFLLTRVNTSYGLLAQSVCTFTLLSHHIYDQTHAILHIFYDSPNEYINILHPENNTQRHMKFQNWFLRLHYDWSLAFNVLMPVLLLPFIHYILSPYNGEKRT